MTGDKCKHVEGELCGLGNGFCSIYGCQNKANKQAIEIELQRGLQTIDRVQYLNENRKKKNPLPLLQLGSYKRK